MTRLIIIFLFISARLLSQSDTLNKTNSSGKKEGYWIQFLDKYLNPTDSAHSVYIGYELYDNGKALFKFKKFNWKLKHILISELDSTRLVSGSIKLIDPKTKKLIGEEKYLRGHPIYIKEHLYSKQKDSVVWNVTYLVDYTKKFENQRGSYYGEQQTKIHQPNGTIEIKKFWYRKVGSKWKFHKITE